MADEIKTNATEVVADKQPIPEVDWEAQAKDLDAKLTKMTSDRDNYRAGLLAAKGKTGDGGSSESEDEKIARIVKEQLFDSEIGKLIQEKEKIAQSALQENKELKVALKSRAQVGASSGQGSGQGKPDVKTEFWTEEQKADLRRRFNNLPVGTKTTFDQYLETAQSNFLKLKQN